MSSIAVTALVAPTAKIGRNVQIGHATRVHDTAVIGDNSVIGDFCIIGHPAGGKWLGCPLQIGAGATIRSHTVLYEGSNFGEKLETGHHVMIREGSTVGDNFRVGSFSDIEGDCIIGDYCRLHSYAHVGRGSRVGNFVWLYSLTTLTNDPLPPSDISAPVTIEDGCVVAVGATLLPGTILRKGSFVTAQSIAAGDVPAGAVVSGDSGRIVSHVSMLRNLEHGKQHPWMHHFGHNYPAEVIPRLVQLESEIVKGRADFLSVHLRNGAGA